MKNRNKYENEHLLCSIVMTHIQCSPCTISKQLNEDKNILFSKRGLWLVFCQRHRSRNSYHARTDLLQYRINLVTWVQDKFQHKTNLALNNRLDPQKTFGFSARTRYAKRCLYFFFLILCSGNRFKHGNPIVLNKYKNGEENITIIVIIAIYITYLSRWCTTIPNKFHEPFWMAYW